MASVKFNATPRMSTSQYVYESADASWDDALVAQRVIAELKAHTAVHSVLDAGCGNGRLSGRMAAEGFDVTAFDTSTSGIAFAQRANPDIRFEVVSAYEDLRARFGSEFDACVAVEVVEHLYDPRQFVRQVRGVLRPGGWLVLTTPYHGYLKNLALALAGKMDAHYTALWDGGHIKFWSRNTLTQLLEEGGFEVTRFEGVGRAPWLWRTMLMTAQKTSRDVPT